MRFDKWDGRIAFVIAYHFEQMFAAVYPDMTVLHDDINMIVDGAICMYVTYETREIPF